MSTQILVHPSLWNHPSLSSPGSFIFPSDYSLPTIELLDCFQENYLYLECLDQSFSEYVQRPWHQIVGLVSEPWHQNPPGGKVRVRVRVRGLLKSKLQPSAGIGNQNLWNSQAPAALTSSLENPYACGSLKATDWPSPMIHLTAEEVEVLKPPNQKQQNEDYKLGLFLAFPKSLCQEA